MVCDRGPSIESSIASGQHHFQPVVDALGKYRQQHGEYPAKLEQLVSDGLLREIPRTPRVDNAHENDLMYTVSKDRRTCEIAFSYHLKNQAFIGDTTYVVWHSTSRTWTTNGPR